MELQKIRELIDVLMASDLAELEFAEGGHKLRLVRRSRSGSSSHDAPAFTRSTTPGTAQTSTGLPTLVEEAPELALPSAPAGVVRSPLYGIVHLTSSPDAPPFVRPGDLVHQGQILCIVEAMKIFHEVKADCGARVDKVFVTPAQEVGAGVPLFRLVPTD